MAGLSRTIPLRIEFACAPNGDVWWTQNADTSGVAFCDGCGERKPVVYSSCLQATKREGQERDYGWAAVEVKP